MVLDTSAVIAILQNEPGSDHLVKAMESAGTLRISAASAVEAGIIMLTRYGEEGELELDLLLHRLGITVVPVTESLAAMARHAYRKFGKGRHPARLNFGDCFAYALAVSLNEPLLFTGDDFSKTDVRLYS
jgi:ribonuclease VapC